ncbi:hypothetical protein A6043_02085 [[Haemophilus] ducreyi]|uniref:hypothetical protein n=1 Tax=Haemophilus ducreyi TaxID=730 RepID=UPI0007CDE5FF|nr:hypothetical protein [[Haemophilus] ducreyi]ANF70202.1 hypothetical protein A6043_02085 [[Haemophilus] ducreyi]ANF72614.1 hypothetical protein A6044_07045 [[Haemophilus] ducreyi]
MRKEQAYKICLEVIFEDEQSLNQVEVNAKTDVLGGRIARIDFNGNSFDILERYEEFITPMQLAFLNSKEAYKTRMQQAINKTLSDLYEEEDWENEEEE